MSDPCQCEKCKQHLDAPETHDAFLKKFRTHLRLGIVKHVGNRPDGQPVYQQIK